MMLADKILRQGQAQAMPIGAARYQRVKYFVAQMRGNAGAIVDHLYHHGQRVAFSHQRDLAGNARAQHDISLSMHGLGCIAHQVQKNLYQLLLVAGQVRQADVVITLYAQAAG